MNTKKTELNTQVKQWALCLVVVAALALAWTAPAHAQKAVAPRAGSSGTWRLIGTTHADRGADHDGIIVKGPFDDFRKVKFKVTNAPLNMQHMVITYDNGQPDKIDVRQNIPQGGESRAIDLKGHRQAQHPQDRLLVRHEGVIEGQGKRDRVRDEVRREAELEAMTLEVE